MQPLNKYHKNLKSIKEGDYVTDGSTKNGIVKSVEMTSVPWGIKWVFTLETGKKITFVE